MPKSQGSKKVNAMDAQDHSGVAHLIRAIGSSAIVEKSDQLTLVVGNGVNPAQVRSAIAAVAHTISSLERWIESKRIALIRPRPGLAIGWFGDRNAYATYLDKEGLQGLSGSLGLTHPVRAVSCVSFGNDSAVDTRIVIAHEAVHLWTLRTGLCPAWHAWPRWLHEGFAQAWDHLAISSEPIATENQKGDPKVRKSFTINEERQNDWRAIAAKTDPGQFLKRDMIFDRRNHRDDYATSWAIVHAMETWAEGELLSELIHYLRVRDLHPFDASSAESISLAWLREKLGERWYEFAQHVASTGRSTKQGRGSMPR